MNDYTIVQLAFPVICLCHCIEGTQSLPESSTVSHTDLHTDLLIESANMMNELADSGERSPRCCQADEFDHGTLNKCISCLEICRPGKDADYCEKNCQQYSRGLITGCKDDMFRHAVTNECVACSEVCALGKDSTYCSRNCPDYIQRISSCCKSDEYYYAPAYQCVHCGKICGPDTDQVYCSSNCPAYSPSNSSTESNTGRISISQNQTVSEMQLNNTAVSHSTLQPEFLGNNNTDKNNTTTDEVNNARTTILIPIFVTMFSIVIITLIICFIRFLHYRHRKDKGRQIKNDHERGPNDEGIPLTQFATTMDEHNNGVGVGNRNAADNKYSDTAFNSNNDSNHCDVNVNNIEHEESHINITDDNGAEIHQRESILTGDDELNYTEHGASSEPRNRENEISNFRNFNSNINSPNESTSEEHLDLVESLVPGDFRSNIEDSPVPLSSIFLHSDTVDTS